MTTLTPTTREADHNRAESQRSKHPHRDRDSTDDNNKLDPAVISGDTKKHPTIIKVNQQEQGGQAAAATTSSSRGRSRANSSSSSSNNNHPNRMPMPPANGEWIQHETHQQKSATPQFQRNTSARSSRSVTAGNGNGDNPAPPRPYKSPELSPYANLDQRAFMNNPKNQVLPSPGGSLPSNHRPTYSTVMSNSKVVEYNEKRVNGEIVSQSVHKQEKVNQM